MKINKRIIGVVMGTVFVFSAVSCGDGSTQDSWARRVSVEKGEIVTLDKETARDKLLGMWIGSVLGLGSGYEYCTTLNNSKPLDAEVVPGTVAYVAMADKYWEPNGAICSGSIGVNALRTGPINDARVVYDKVYSDDDIHVDVLNQFIFRDYGPDLGAQDIAEAWDKYGVADVGGGETVTATIRNLGYMAPYTGQRMYGNVGYWVTESWIENETLGSIFPYMPRTAEAYAEIFTTVQGDALCVYLGKLCVLMQCLAWQYDDAKVILEKAFERMDKNNEIYEMYKYVLGCYEDGVDWRTACVGVVERGTNCKLIKLSDTAGFSIDANAGMIFIGLIYGENDFEKTLKITSLCGLDGDCTASTVGGLMGLIDGFDALPQKYKDYLNGDSVYYNYTGANGADVGVYWGAFAYCSNFLTSMSFNELTELTLENLESQVIARGGKLENGAYHIVSQPIDKIPQVAVVNKSFERGDETGWSFEGAETSSFATTESIVHLGKYGGVLMTETTEDSAAAYQTVSLIPGNRYRATIWINGCPDREVRIFAGEKYRSYLNPLSVNTAHSKLELYFTADSSIEKIGLRLCKGSEDSYSTTLYFDDFSVEDVTHLTDGCRQRFTATDYYISPSAYVSDNTVKLECTDGLRFDFEGMRGYQTFKIYYKNATGSLAHVSVQIDGREVGVIPLPAQGSEADFNEGNAAIAYLYAGTGAHEFKLVLDTFESIEIERVEVYGGNAVFEK